jgi:uncharacterized membrane-anchored protein YjiN (DUF445 family)
MKEKFQSLSKKIPEQIEEERSLFMQLTRFMTEDDRKAIIKDGVTALSKFMGKEEARKKVDEIIQKIQEIPQPPFMGARKL